MLLRKQSNPTKNMIWQLRLQEKSMMKSRPNIGWMMTIHWYQADLFSRLLTIKVISRITTGCSHLRCLHEKSSLDKDIFFSLVKAVPEEFPSEKFTLESVEQSAITITTIKQRKTNISWLQRPAENENISGNLGKKYKIKP